ncbi:MAG: serine/threonine-protein kinase [Polyangiaceae bacterium]
MHSLGAKDHASAAGTTPGDDPPTEPATAPAAARRDDTTAPSGARRSIQAGASIDHYKLIEPLGRGGMGDVWLARDVRLGRRVALKFLHGAQRWQVKRFVAEARTTARLTHENIVSLYDIGEHRGSPYMALEYVRGQSLRAWLGERAAPEDGATPSPAVPPRQVIELVVQVVRALVYAHEAGVIHRDLKLANVMVTDTGAVKVLDFGIAKLMVDAALADSISTGEPDSTASITAGGKLVGTLAYMSPEQMGAGTVDPRTDLWAVGIMLHLLAVGRHPLGTRDAPPTTDALLGVADLNVPMPSVRESHPSLGRLALVIDACLAKRKEDRIGSARELLALLEAALENRAPLPDDVPPYLGLSVFQESDAGRFFGRKQAVHQAFARLREQPLLAVIGPSGAGKSSFVRAGLLPALKRREGAWESLVLRPGARPLNALAELLFRHGELGPRSRADMPVPDEDANTLVYKPHESLRSRLEAEPAYLGELLRARARRRTEGVILFCDQLEDVFTRAAPNERAAFFACLCGAAGDDASPVRVIVTMRSDFLDRLTDAPSLAELAGRGVLLLGPMTRDELRTALVEPARLAGHRFESEEMVTEMLDTLGGAAGALPLLQFTAARLWESRDQRAACSPGTAIARWEASPEPSRATPTPSSPP